MIRRIHPRQWPRLQQVRAILLILLATLTVGASANADPVHITLTETITCADPREVIVVGGSASQVGTPIEMNTTPLPIGSTVTIKVTGCDSVWTVSEVTLTGPGGALVANSPLDRSITSTLTMTVNVDKVSNTNYDVLGVQFKDQGAFTALVRKVPFSFIPDSPTDITVTPGTNSALVSWTASPRATSYKVDLGGGRECTTATTSCTVSNLTPGTTYTVAVTANASNPDVLLFYTGTSQPATTTFLLPGPPGAPTGVTAVRGPLAGQATVSWSAPSSTGGLSISDYEVTSTPGGQTCSVSASDSLPLQCTVTGLTNGTTYTFAVRARNESGFGANSTPSAAVLVGTVPSQPTTVEATLGIFPGQAVVSWSPPSDPGGPAISGYRVTSQPGGVTCQPTSLIGTPLSCTLSNLTLGTSYTFVVEAENALGWSSPSDATQALRIPSTATPPTAASASLGISPGDVVVSWSPPSDDGGLSISDYRVTSQPGGVTCRPDSLLSIPLSCSVVGLDFGATYTFVVEAENALGWSSPSDATTSVTIPTFPAAPSAVTASLTATPGEALVTWTPPIDDGGTPILAYRVTSEPGALLCVTSEVDPVPTTCTVTDLAAGTEYTFSVEAQNAVGWSDPSEASGSLSMGDRPPGITLEERDVVAGNRSATLIFDAPSDDPWPVTAYAIDIGVASSSETCSAGVTDPISLQFERETLTSDADSGRSILTLSREALEAQGAALNNRTAYCVRLRAINAVGEGPESDWRLLTPRTSGLTAPTNLAASSDEAASVAQFPGRDRGSGCQLRLRPQRRPLDPPQRWGRGAKPA
jgi:hypothetical protein